MAKCVVPKASHLGTCGVSGRPLFSSVLKGPPRQESGHSDYKQLIQIVGNDYDNKVVHPTRQLAMVRATKSRVVGTCSESDPE